MKTLSCQVLAAMVFACAALFCFSCGDAGEKANAGADNDSLDGADNEPGEADFETKQNGLIGSGDPQGEGVGIFGYMQYTNNEAGWDTTTNLYFTQVVNSHMGNEIMYGRGPDSNTDYWKYLCKFNVDDQQFIMKHRWSRFAQSDTNDYQITKIYETGNLGITTDHGTWGNEYPNLIGAKSGGNTYIFGQNKDKYWFVQRVKSGGVLGEETSSGTWAHYYDVAVPMEWGWATYIYFQTSERTLDNGGYWHKWFISELTEDGRLVDTKSGYWDNFYPANTALKVGGEWYIFGHRKPTGGTDGPWFLQHITGGGLVGAETDSGTWGHYYQTITSFTAEDGKTYLFGQNTDKHWFIQEVLPGGIMGDETDSGNWNYYYRYVLPFTFDRLYLEGDDWMTKMSGTIGNRKLANITLPATHDSGVNAVDFSDGLCTSANACNTVAQVVDIKGQLDRGARYFDVRPVIANDYKSSANWYTGHFGKIMDVGGCHEYAGCRGESLLQVFKDVNAFFSLSGHSRELVILKLSHCLTLDTAIGCAEECGSGPFGYLKGLIQQNVQRLVKCSDNCDLMTMTLDQILAKGNVIALVDGLDSDKANGIFSWGGNDLPIYDEYSNSNSAGKMVFDQLGKLEDPGNHKNQLFLLSWTLTLSPAQAAVECLLPDNWFWNLVTDRTTILDLAQGAREALFDQVSNGLERGLITQTLYPNIIYLDAYSDNLGTRTAMFVNRFNENKVLWASGTYDHPGAWLVMQDDGNLVVYSPHGKALWASDTYGHPGAYMEMQSDGNLVVYSRGGRALWASNTWGHPGANYIMQDDGNLVVYDKNGAPLWASKTQSPGAQLVMQSDGNLVIYAKDEVALWSSGTYGHPGATYKMQDDGNLVVYSQDGKALWASDTYGHPGAVMEMQPDGNLVIRTEKWTR